MLEAEIWLVDASAINLLGKKVEKSCAGPGAVVQVEEELSAGAARHADRSNLFWESDSVKKHDSRSVLNND